MADKRIGLIGARSFVGKRVSLLLAEQGYTIIPFSRREEEGMVSLESAKLSETGHIGDWIYVAPIWTVPEHFQFLQECGVQRLVALSSTSRFTKIASASEAERDIASQVKYGEEKVMEWAQLKEVEVVIFQTTLIYGHGQDKNVTQIAQVIERFGFFPLLGRGEGLRQPVHVDDVANACYFALKVKGAQNHDRYILSGGEVLSYRKMVERIFLALGKRPRFVRCPLIVFTTAERLARLISFHGVTAEMAVRMNRDQDFDHTAASRDFGFHPRPFFPKRSDCISS